jgi:hypothetical protein
MSQNLPKIFPNIWIVLAYNTFLILEVLAKQVNKYKNLVLHHIITRDITFFSNGEISPNQVTLHAWSMVDTICQEYCVKKYLH